MFKSGTADFANGKSRHMFYAGSDNGSETVITIEDGYFNLQNKSVSSSYLVAGANGVIYVKGGTFMTKANPAPVQELNGGQVIISGGTFYWDPTAWLAEGYQAVKADGTSYWVVSKI